VVYFSDFVLGIGARAIVTGSRSETRTEKNVDCNKDEALSPDNGTLS